jgi:hypothetical protein
MDPETRYWLVTTSMADLGRRADEERLAGSVGTDRDRERHPRPVDRSRGLATEHPLGRLPAPGR